MKYILFSYFILTNSYSVTFECLLGQVYRFGNNDPHKTTKLTQSLEKIKNSRATRIKEKYQGKQLSFPEAVNELMEYLPTDLQKKYRKVASNVNIIHSSELKFEEIHLISKKTSSKSNKEIPVAWSSNKINSLNDVDVALNKAIDVLTESQVNRINELSVLTRKRSAFLKENIQTISDHVIMKLLYRDESGLHFPKGSKTEEALHIAKTLVKSTFSKKYNNIKGLKSTSTHEDICKTVWPFGLYKYISKAESESIALRYYFALLNDVQIIAAAILTPIIAPKLYRAYIYHKEKEEVRVKKPEDIPIVKKMVQHYGQDPQGLLNGMHQNIDHLKAPEDEKKLFQNLLNELNNELKNNNASEKKTFF